MSTLPPPGDLPADPPPADLPSPPSSPAAVPPSVRIAVHPSPKRRRTGLWLGLAGVVAVAAGAVAVVAASDDESKVVVATTTTVDGSEARDTWQAIVDEIDFDAGDNGSGGEMERCPFGEVDEWTTEAPEAVADVVDDASGGDDYLEVFLSNVESADQYVVQCLYFDERTETQLGIAVTERLDMDYRQELAELLPDYDLTFDPDRALAGGTLVSYCAQGGGGGEALPFCEADWYDDDLLITVYYSDEEASTDVVAQWMQDSLPMWLQALTDTDVDDLDVTTVTY
jgi:hypothetical protein